MTSMRKHINLFASAHTAVAKSLNTIIIYMNVMVIGLALKEEELGPQVSIYFGFPLIHTLSKVYIQAEMCKCKLI